MNEGRRIAVATAALLLGFAALYCILILTALHAVGTDADLYYAEQMKAGILPASGLTDDALRELDGRMAAYLGGEASALEADPPFNAREMTHMRDCYDLFALLRKVRSRLIPWAVLLIVGGAYLLQFDRRKIRKVAWLSPLIPLAPLGAFALYAALDFDAAFTLFHRILFRNDLWLLDPRTDLLIRVCPESMFMHMGVRVGVFGLIGMLAVPVLVTLLAALWPGRKENAWKTTTRRGPAPKRYGFKSGGTR